jgi:hypothetical protein
MKRIILLAVLAFASQASAQAPAEPVEGAKTVAPKVKVVKAAKKSTARRHQDARHCLQHASNDAIIRCAEEYL